jgi:acetyltransferase-like isoleucine patch superfamily enzyme
MRNKLRAILNLIVVLKLKLFNSKTIIGKNSRIDWSVKFKGINPIHIGDYCSIRTGALLVPHCGYIKIGNNCSVGAYNILDGSGGLEIGDEVRIGPLVCIYSANHNFQDLDQPIYKQGLSLSKVIIKNNVWIGANATILAGVTIDSGSVIAAGSIVTKNVQSNVVVGGNPAKILKYRE